MVKNERMKERITLLGINKMLMNGAVAKELPRRSGNVCFLLSFEGSITEHTWNINIKQ
jgi:hypothetical protein